MSSKSYALALAVALIGGVFGGAVFGRFSVPAQAQRESSAGESREEASPNTRKWEYCAITKAGQAPSIARGAYTITYFGPSGVRVTAIDESFSDRSAMPRAIAKLGEEGWELVGEGPLEFKAGTGGEALYFKRRRT